MTIRKQLAYLQKVNCDETGHSNRSLLDHLLGTYRILRSWEKESYVCRAGLFHSIYGSRNFKDAKVGINNRSEVAGVIGKRSEQLVFYFSMVQIDDLQRARTNKNKVLIQVGDRSFEISNIQYRNLIEITLANFLEQKPYLLESHGLAIEKFEKNFEWMRCHLSSLAKVVI